MRQWAVILVCVSLTAWSLNLDPITSLDQVDPSGDNYPQLLPPVSNPSLFHRRRVLFALDHGVEDHEIIYPHQYFTDRGAQVIFGCPHSGTAVLSDFFKPKYVVRCAVNINQVDLEDYDVLFIPGGLPSSTAIRTASPFISKLRTLWSRKNPSKSFLIAIICSGNEVLVDSEILNSLQKITGSPASAVTLRNALQALGKDPNLFTDLNTVSYASQSPFRPHLVLGRNPDASPFFVSEIGFVWAGIREPVPTSENGSYSKLNIGPDGFYRHSSFRRAVLRDLPDPDGNQIFTAPSKEMLAPFENKTILIAVSSGINHNQVAFFSRYLAEAGAEVVLTCPNWIPRWKNGHIFLFSEPPVLPKSWANCTLPFSEVEDTPHDGIIVPGGLFSTHGVLRNDGDLTTILNKPIPKLFVGSGKELLISIGCCQGISEGIPADNQVQHDLEDVGATSISNAGSVSISSLNSVACNTETSDLAQGLEQFAQLLATPV